MTCAVHRPQPRWFRVPAPLTGVAGALAILAPALLVGCATATPPPAPLATTEASSTPEAEPGAQDDSAAAPEAPAEPPRSNAPLEPLLALPTNDALPAKPDPEAPADLTRPPADAQKLPSGLVTKVLARGTGTEHPGVDDTVRIQFSGWTSNGVRFESNVDSGHGAEYIPSRAIRGWTEGLPLMVVGEKRRFWVPGALAYGDAPRPYGMPYGPLVYDVELISFRKPPAPPEVPADLTAPPADARRTPSGLVYRVLSKGSGKTHPRPRSVVEVHYSGWTTDGKMFDSSVARGETASFPLNNVIRGWTEGLQLMVVGERARFWIPAKLAYGEKPASGPAGPLVFDVELIDIKEPPRP